MEGGEADGCRARVPQDQGEGRRDGKLEAALEDAGQVVDAWQPLGGSFGCCRPSLQLTLTFNLETHPGFAPAGWVSSGN